MDSYGKRKNSSKGMGPAAGRGGLEISKNIAKDERIISGNVEKHGTKTQVVDEMTHNTEVEQTKYFQLESWREKDKNTISCGQVLS